jgi:hypothetical protein
MDLKGGVQMRAAVSERGGFVVCASEDRCVYVFNTVPVGQEVLADGAGEDGGGEGGEDGGEGGGNRLNLKVGRQLGKKGKEESSRSGTPEPGQSSANASNTMGGTLPASVGGGGGSGTSGPSGFLSGLMKWQDPIRSIQYERFKPSVEPVVCALIAPSSLRKVLELKGLREETPSLQSSNEEESEADNVAVEESATGMFIITADLSGSIKIFENEVGTSLKDGKPFLNLSSNSYASSVGQEVTASGNQSTHDASNIKSVSELNAGGESQHRASRYPIRSRPLEVLIGDGQRGQIRSFTAPPQISVTESEFPQAPLRASQSLATPSSRAPHLKNTRDLIDDGYIQFLPRSMKPLKDEEEEQLANQVVHSVVSHSLQNVDSLFSYANITTTSTHSHHNVNVQNELLSTQSNRKRAATVNASGGIPVSPLPTKSSTILAKADSHQSSSLGPNDTKSKSRLFGGISTISMNHSSGESSDTGSEKTSRMSSLLSRRHRSATTTNSNSISSKATLNSNLKQASTTTATSLSSSSSSTSTSSASTSTTAASSHVNSFFHWNLSKDKRDSSTHSHHEK